MKKIGNIFLFVFMGFSLLAFCADIPPLELINFTTVQNVNKVDIRWSTSVETGGPYFTIEKSKDGKEFTKVVDVPAQEGSTIYSDYFETDYQPYEGVSYYRIKQTDEAGNYRYSQTVTLKNEEQVITTTLTITRSLKNEETASDSNKSNQTLLVLRDANGNDYYSVVSLDTKSNSLTAYDMPSSVSKGIYHIVGSSINELYNQQVIVK